MPTPNLSADKASRGSHRNVTYVDAKGQTMMAQVVGGAGTLLVLRLPHRINGATREIGVGKRTALNQTNVWY